MAFIIYWKDGREQVVDGETFEEACEKAGIQWGDFERIALTVLIGL